MNKSADENPYRSPAETSTAPLDIDGHAILERHGWLVPVIGLAFAGILMMRLMLGAYDWFNGVLMLSILLCQFVGLGLTILLAAKREKMLGDWLHLKRAIAANGVAIVINGAGFWWLLSLANTGI